MSCGLMQVSGEKKAVGSTAGMQTSVDTSPLLKVGWMFDDDQHRLPGEVGQSHPWGCPRTVQTWHMGTRSVGVDLRSLL